jgi:polyphenol oxidase
MELIIPEFGALAERIGGLVTTRTGGVSLGPYGDHDGVDGLNLGIYVNDSPEHVKSNRLRLRTLLPSEPAWLAQVHGNRVVDAADVAAMPAAPQADASIATRAGIVCAIQTADCLPVLFWDRDATTVGAAHAGWRGLAGGVLEQTIGRMRKAGAGEIHAWLGPAIGPERFEVGQDVFDAFAGLGPAAVDAFKPIAGQAGKYLADIYVLARLALASSGVTKIVGGGLCTVSDHRRFYSYRRDRTTGRMASLIWLK